MYVCAICVLFVMFSVYIVCSMSSDLVCEDPRHHTYSYSPESVARMEFHTLYLKFKVQIDVW